jgi:hypothetical protein
MKNGVSIYSFCWSIAAFIALITVGNYPNNNWIKITVFVLVVISGLLGMILAVKKKGEK